MTTFAVLNMKPDEYFEKLAQLEHEVVVANAKGNQKLALKRWNAMIEFQANCWPGLGETDASS